MYYIFTLYIYYRYYYRKSDKNGHRMDVPKLDSFVSKIHLKILYALAMAVPALIVRLEHDRKEKNDDIDLTNSG